MQILKSDDRFIIYGPASVEIVDRERDKIRADALAFALPQLLKRARFSRNHEDILVGEILPEFTDGGKVYKTNVVNGRLMVVGEVWDDTRAAQETRQGILEKKLRSYSISGEALQAQKVCEPVAGCYRDISKLDLHAITICERGMNQGANFQVIQKSDEIFFTIATLNSARMQISDSVRKWITMSEEEIQKAEYPWEECIKDQKTNGYTEEQAQRICAAIKNRTVAHKMVAENLQFEKAFADTVQKVLNDSDFSYILGKMIPSHASRKEVHEEVQKAMTKEEPKPPEKEEDKKTILPAEKQETDGGIAEVKAMCEKMLAMMQQMVGGTGTEQKALVSDKPFTKADAEVLVKQMLAEKAATDPDGITPRPAIKKQNEITGGAIVDLMKDPDKLAKMSFEEIDALTERLEEVGL